MSADSELLRRLAELEAKYRRIAKAEYSNDPKDWGHRRTSAAYEAVADQLKALLKAHSA